MPDNLGINVNISKTKVEHPSKVLAITKETTVTISKPVVAAYTIQQVQLQIS